MLYARIKKMSWFLFRPHLYPELVRRIRRFFSSNDSVLEDPQVSKEWCREVEVSQEQAFIKLIGESELYSVNECFSEVFTTAEEVANKCPVKMGGPGALDFIYSIAEHTKAQKVIETGVAYGWSSLAFLLSLSKRVDAHLYSVDMPYPGVNNDEYVGCVIPDDLRHVWTLFRQADRQAIPKAIAASATEVDIVHYDSDKSYDGRMWAYPQLWASLREGGLFVSDDIEDNAAFKNFSDTLQLKPIVFSSWGGTKTKYIGVIQKPPHVS
jgi:predicted O-methyltransferase YrrM